MAEVDSMTGKDASGTTREFPTLKPLIERVGALTAPAAGSVNAQLAALLAKLVDGPATEAKQIEAITALTSINANIDTLRGLVDGLEPLVAATNTALGTVDGRVDGLEALITTLNGYVDGVETLIGSTNTALSTLGGYMDGVEALLAAATPAGENFIGSLGGKSFDVAVAPGVTNGAYSPGDIVGGLLEFAAGRVANGKVTLQSVQIVSKAAVTPTWTLHIFSADPSATTKTDNAAYALAVADAFKWRGSVTGFTLSDNGTPNCWEVANLAKILTTDASSKFYGLLVDGSGVTLTSTSDIQVRAAGYQD